MSMRRHLREIRDRLLNEGVKRDRDFDATFAEGVLGWQPLAVPPDIDGHPSGPILSRDGVVPPSVVLPPRGGLHRAYLVPELYLLSTERALQLAAEHGVEVAIAMRAIAGTRQLRCETVVWRNGTAGEFVEVPDVRGEPPVRAILVAMVEARNAFLAQPAVASA